MCDLLVSQSLFSSFNLYRYVKVELDVLQPKDIEDIKSFACTNKMDYIAVSFVQTGEDCKLVRKILDENGGENIQIISKIENEEGMRNFDEILKYTDGVMVGLLCKLNPVDPQLESAWFQPLSL
jgi:pyruvate kinase